MTEEYVVYTLINTDLKMSNGKIVSQSQHAIQKMLQSLSKHSTCYTKWKNNNFAKVCLKSSQSTIETLSELYSNCYTVHDAGKTQIPSGSLTCLIFEPMLKNSMKEIKELKLL